MTRYLAALPAIFVLGALAERALLAFAPARIARDLAQPLAVATGWGWFGAAVFSIFALTIAAAACVAIVVAHKLRTVTLDGRALPATAFVAIVAAWTWPCAFSSDVYAYAAYGDLANRGLNPYAFAPPALHDAVIDAARLQWSGSGGDGNVPPCVYGPAFVALMRALVALCDGGSNALAPLVAWRALAALAFLGAVVAGRLALTPLGPARRDAVLAIYALNPVVLWSVAEGHNDTLVVALAALAAVSASRGRTFVAGFAFGATPLFKASGLAFAAAFALDALLGAMHHKRAQLVSAALALAAGLALSAALALPPLLEPGRAIATHGAYRPEVSVQALGGPLAGIALGGLFAATACVALANGRRAAFAWIGLAAAAFLPNDYPWYALWLTPFSLFGINERPATALWLVTIASSLRYLPDAYGNMGSAGMAAVAATATLPFLFALTGLGPTPALTRKAS